MPLLIEFHFNNAWHVIGEHADGDRPGSLSNRASGERHLIVFYSVQGTSEIRQSNRGFDLDYGDLREVAALDGFTSLATLSPGESYELDLQTDSMPVKVRARFRRE